MEPGKTTQLKLFYFISDLIFKMIDPFENEIVDRKKNKIQIL